MRTKRDLPSPPTEGRQAAPTGPEGVRADWGHPQSSAPQDAPTRGVRGLGVSDTAQREKGVGEAPEASRGFRPGPPKVGPVTRPSAPGLRGVSRDGRHQYVGGGVKGVSKLLDLCRVNGRQRGQALKLSDQSGDQGISRLLRRCGALYGDNQLLEHVDDLLLLSLDGTEGAEPLPELLTQCHCEPLSRRHACTMGGFSIHRQPFVRHSICSSVNVMLPIAPPFRHSGTDTIAWSCGATSSVRHIWGLRVMQNVTIRTTNGGLLHEW